MKTILALSIGLLVLLTGFWAYQENYRTREALRELRAVQAEIGALRAELAVLEVEWAYLNRPERLRALADLNFERLQLIPMRPEHFGHIDQIAYPPTEAYPDPAPADVDAMTLVAVGHDGAEVVDMGEIAAPEAVPDARDGQFP